MSSVDLWDDGLFRSFYTLENGEEKTESIKVKKGQVLDCLSLPLTKIIEFQEKYMDGKHLYARLLQEEGMEWWKY